MALVDNPNGTDIKLGEACQIVSTTIERPEVSETCLVMTNRSTMIWYVWHRYILVMSPRMLKLFEICQ